jgi:pimeloyl-ACP methyl ester carboxylesterase
MEATEKRVEVGEYAINVGSAGAGEPLVMLHGSEPGENWRVWEPMMQLSDAYKLVAPDLLGFGASSKPAETPDYRAQARAVRDLVEKMKLGNVALLGGGWGGQVALEYALEWPDEVKAVVVIASSYDKEQLKRLQKLRRPTLIIYAEDDMVTQLKAGYLLRDAIGTSRLEILDPVAKDPNQDFRMSHRLQKFRAPRVVQLVKLFLSNPEAMVTEPPEMENELKGMALRKEEEGKEGTPAPASGKP